MSLQKMSNYLEIPYLSILMILPILGSIILCLPKISNSEKHVKLTAHVISALNFVISLALFFSFDNKNINMQFTEFGGRFGVDGYSILFILLSTFLIMVCNFLSSFNIKKKLGQYFICFLLMGSILIGLFCSLDILLFYIFFESILIPMYLIIGIWGGDDRIYAAFKFFLYTLAGSLFFLLAIVYIYTKTGTTSILKLYSLAGNFSPEEQIYLWLAFFIAFAVKVPMLPVHTWLPDAHVQAPTAGSVILAGVLLKIGGYGFIRFSLPMFPEASKYFAGFMLTLSAIAVVYASLVALMQDDMKKLIAYSSIAHMGFVTAGIFSLSTAGLDGAVFQMISHGLISSVLFISVGALYDRMHTKEIAFYGGLTAVMPNFAFFFMLFTLASVGLPGTCGFVGEFLILLGVFKSSKVFCIVIASGIILGASYMLWLYARVMFDEIKNPSLLEINDITAKEKIIFWTFAILIIFLGIYPNFIMNDISQATEILIKQLNNLNN